MNCLNVRFYRQNYCFKADFEPVFQFNPENSNSSCGPTPEAPTPEAPTPEAQNYGLLKLGQREAHENIKHEK